MSSFIQNLQRGGFKLDTKLTQFRSADGRVYVTYVPSDEWLHGLDRKTNAALFYAGRTALRKFKKLLGRKKPQERTKKGRISAAWKKMQAGQRHPYPYRVTGVLREGIEFVVDKRIKNVLTGPYLISGMQGMTKPSKPVPQLLQEGGHSMVPVKLKRGRVVMQSVVYRAFPYKEEPGRDQIAAFQKRISASGWS